MAPLQDASASQGDGGAAAPPVGAARAYEIAHPWLAFSIGAVIVAGVYALLALPGHTVSKLIEEDGIIEWTGAIGLFAGSGLFLAAFLTARRRGPSTGLNRLGVIVLALMSAGLFFAGGEEISWGQRLIGFGEPKGFSSLNAQDETNLHNLNIFQGTLIDGDRLFKLGYLALFVVIPLVAWAWPRARRWLDRILPITPPWLALLFLLAYLGSEVVNHTFSGIYDSIYPLTHSTSEVQESCVEFMAGIVGLLSLLRMRGASRSAE